ncbi:ATP-dependent RNA helicase [Hapalosiphon sp. MRB220]|nr:ATP-dependent RNA helicase [Hapalosiphon sp. MRB220]
MPNFPENLLAKSKRQGKDITLESHLRDTDNAATQIFRLNGRWGQNWCRFFKLEGEAIQQKFLLNLRVAALFHDIGKANEDFYAAVTTAKFLAQVLRHEHLSALIICLPQVRNWLSSKDSNLDVDVITAAVLSHHLKAGRDQKTTEDGKSYRWCQPQSSKKSLELYLIHDEVTRILNTIAELANLDPPPSLPITPWKAGSVWEQTYKKGRTFADQFGRTIRENKERQRFLVAVKAGLIVSDAAASGLVREGHEITRWIEEVVHSQAITPNEIAEKIIQKRIQQIEEKTKKPFVFQEFQNQVAEQGSKALLLAACGAGKTLAAWKWAEAQSRIYNIGKVIFLYPTRGTATEGFRDYVGWAPETDATLITGTARYELEAMAENPSDAIAGKTLRSEASERLYALGFWSKRFFSATVDQFLSFMEHSYQSLCLLPVLADSAVIIDEVHSFDRSMFDSLISFLQTFHIPVLCMTATLPKSRRDELVATGLKVFPTDVNREKLNDLKEKEEAPRYLLEPVDNFGAAFDKAVAAYNEQRLRVLWVVNTVDRCLAIAQKLETRLKTSVLTYHSRFRLCDRQRIHSDTVAAFAYSESKVPDRAIAVTTQVCEMSLDLDADVLITEIAPVSALVQRFGRANRHLKREFAILHTYKPPSDRPYHKEDLEKAKAFLSFLSSGADKISQYQLAVAFDDYTRQERKADGSSPFLDSGYYATPGSFRDTDEFAVPCILDRDLDVVKQVLNSTKKHEKEKFIINVPKKWANQRTEEHCWLPKYLGVAQWEGHYDESRGFITKSLDEVEFG